MRADETPHPRTKFARYDMNVDDMLMEVISKAFEMSKLLPWAESAQGATITEAHVAYLASSDECMDNDPQRLSRDLWGYLNLALTGKAKDAFKNVEKGNGFDAWRTLVHRYDPRRLMDETRDWGDLVHAQS